MTQTAQDPWNTSNSVPHFTPLKSAEYLTDPAVIKAYNKLSEPPGDHVRLLRRISRSLHFGIWLRSVVWSCSLVFVVCLSFMLIVRMDLRMKSLIYPETTAVSEDETESESKATASQTETEEKVAEKEGPVIR